MKIWKALSLSILGVCSFITANAFASNTASPTTQVESDAQAIAPLPFSANYSVYYGNIDVADVSLVFSNVDGHLTLVTESQAKGLASLVKSGLQREESVLRLRDNRLEGQQYTSTNIRSRRRIRGPDREEHRVELEISFDWKTKTANYNGDNGHIAIPLLAGSLDRQALPALLRHELRQATAVDSTARPEVIDYHFLDRDTLRYYKMEYQGDEVIETALGSLNTAKYVYTTDSDKLTIMWLAEQHDWLPVRFDKIKPGNPTLSMVITSTH